MHIPTNDAFLSIYEFFTDFIRQFNDLATHWYIFLKLKCDVHNTFVENSFHYGKYLNWHR